MIDKTTAPIRREKLTFPNRKGEQLAALLERPQTEPHSFALFAHCFTCSKDIGTATRISRALAARGFGVLRFDFTGLGNSEGDFANTNFTSNVQDLVSAADCLRERYRAPALLVGHSLGGAAVLVAAVEVPEVQAVVTIAAPSDTAHLAHLLGEHVVREVEATGAAQITLGGQCFTIRKQFLDDIAEQVLMDDVRRMGKALLILHSPRDDVVDIGHAGHIFAAARHPKSFISLDDADHLLSRPEDAEYAAQTIAAWASRYVREPG